MSSAGEIIGWVCEVCRGNNHIACTDVGCRCIICQEGKNDLFLSKKPTSEEVIRGKRKSWRKRPA